jgi:hypothetical protein
MDAEDSPWGGMSPRKAISYKLPDSSFADVPSRSSSNANLVDQAAEAEEQGFVHEYVTWSFD